MFPSQFQGVTFLFFSRGTRPNLKIQRIKPDKIGRNWVQFNATVSETEGLFNTEYHYYEHDLSGGYRIACDEYHLPQHVREHVDFAVSSFLAFFKLKY